MTIHQIHQALETQLDLLINTLEIGEYSRVYEIPLTSAVIFAESRTKLCVAIKIPTCPPVPWHPVTKILDSCTRQSKDGSSEFVLRFAKPNSRDILPFVSDLLFDIGIDETSSEEIFLKLKSWSDRHRLLNLRLSQDSEIGLFGELIVLELLLQNGVISVDDWKGPDGGAKDFVSQSVMIEVKTSLSDSATVQISSLQQLTPEHTQLYLLRVRVSAQANAPTLPELIATIRGELTPSDSAIFNRKLRDAGYFAGVESLYQTGYHLEGLKYCNIDHETSVLNSIHVTEHIPAVTQARYELDCSLLPFSDLEIENFHCADRWMNIVRAFSLDELVVLARANPGWGVRDFTRVLFNNPKDLIRHSAFVVDALGQHKRTSGEDLYESLQDTSQFDGGEFDWAGIEITARDDSDLTRLTKMSAKSHSDLHDYSFIWKAMQTYPTIADIARELGYSYPKMHKICSYLESLFEAGALKEFLRVSSQLSDLEKILGHHSTSAVMMNLRMLFAEFMRNPVSVPPPSNEDIQWAYQQFLADSNLGLDSGDDNLTDPSEPEIQSPIERVLDQAGRHNFSRTQGAWGRFQEDCLSLTGFGWKMGMAKSASGKDNAVNRLYTTGMIRAYPRKLVHVLYLDDYFEEIIHVYQTEFVKVLRSTPVLVLMEETRNLSWQAKYLLIQDRHPLNPFGSEQELRKLFTTGELIRCESSSLALLERW